MEHTKACTRSRPPKMQIPCILVHSILFTAKKWSRRFPPPPHGRPTSTHHESSKNQERLPRTGGSSRGWVRQTNYVMPNPVSVNQWRSVGALVLNPFFFRAKGTTRAYVACTLALRVCGRKPRNGGRPFSMRGSSYFCFRFLFSFSV